MHKIVSKALDAFVAEIKKPEHQDYIKEHILSPTIKHVFEQMYPYILITIIIVILLIALMVSILFLLMKK